jgi:tetratricopeptide (TPR) repeat protein
MTYASWLGASVLNLSIVGISVMGLTAIPTIVQPPHAVALSNEKVAQVAQSVTLMIKIPDGNGSGTLIKRNNDIYTVLTANHVIKDIAENNINVIAPDGKIYSIIPQSVRQLGSLDLAVLQFRSANKYAIIELGDPKQIAIGQGMFVAGFPQPDAGLGTAFTFIKGNVNSILPKPLADGYQLLYSNQTKNGMSGGPVINRDGKLIAIHGITDGEGALQGGIPINLFTKLLGNRTPSSVSPKPTKPPTATLTRYQQAEKFFNLGLAKHNLNDYQGAANHYSEAIRLRSDYAAAYNNRGLAKVYLGDKTGALADYNQAIRLKNDFAQAYFNRGQVFALLGRRKEALGEFRMAAKYARHQGLRYLYHRAKHRIRDLEN